jgi:hypothetical protein
MTDLNEFEKNLKNLCEIHSIFNNNEIKLSSEIVLTDMAIKEHGQPYQPTKLLTDMTIRENEQQQYKSNSSTKMTMAIKEHGQPYKNNAC